MNKEALIKIIKIYVRVWEQYKRVSSHSSWDAGAFECAQRILDRLCTSRGREMLHQELLRQLENGYSMSTLDYDLLYESATSHYAHALRYIHYLQSAGEDTKE